MKKIKIIICSLFVMTLLTGTYSNALGLTSQANANDVSAPKGEMLVEDATTTTTHHTTTRHTTTTTTGGLEVE